MGQYDFTYEFPADFDKRVVQILQQKMSGAQLAIAFKSCSYEYEKIDLAYYAGMRGDVWDKYALDFTIEGSSEHVTLLKNRVRDVDDAMSKALRPSTSGFVVREILFLENDEVAPFPASDNDRLNADIATANAILSDLIRIGERACSNVTYRNGSSENSINDFFRDTLSLMGYSEVKDQTRHGISTSGADAGEVDILITKEGKEVAIFEGLNLSSVNTSYIDEHIRKAIINYNALGTATFVVAYVNVADFEGFWERYTTHLKSFQFPLQIKQQLAVKPNINAAIRIAEMMLSRDGFDFPVYFIAMNLR